MMKVVFCSLHGILKINNMKDELLNSIYKALNKYAENHKGEYPKAILLHSSKKQELTDITMLTYNSSAVHFNQSNGLIYIFGVQVYFSYLIPEDNFILSEKPV